MRSEASVPCRHAAVVWSIRVAAMSDCSDRVQCNCKCTCKWRSRRTGTRDSVLRAKNHKSRTKNQGPFLIGPSVTGRLSPLASRLSPLASRLSPLTTRQRSLVSSSPGSRREARVESRCGDLVAATLGDPEAPPIERPSPRCTLPGPRSSPVVCRLSVRWRSISRQAFIVRFDATHTDTGTYGHGRGHPWTRTRVAAMHAHRMLGSGPGPSLTC